MNSEHSTGADAKPVRTWRWYSFFTWKTFAVLFLCTIVGSIILITMHVKRTLMVVRREYAARYAAFSVIDHLRENDGQMPKNWDDLEPHFDRLSSQWCDFEHLKKNVGVQFGGDAVKILAAQESTETHAGEFVWLIEFPNYRWETQGDPNEFVREYLKGLADQKELIDD